jgi:hypothetical protein
LLLPPVPGSDAGCVAGAAAAITAAAAALGDGDACGACDGWPAGAASQLGACCRAGQAPAAPAAPGTAAGAAAALASAACCVSSSRWRGVACLLRVEGAASGCASAAAGAGGCAPWLPAAAVGGSGGAWCVLWSVSGRADVLPGGGAVIITPCCSSLRRPAASASASAMWGRRMRAPSVRSRHPGGGSPAACQTIRKADVGLAALGTVSRCCTSRVPAAPVGVGC